MRLIVSAVVLTGAGASDSGNGKPAIKLPYHYKHPGRLDPSVFSGATNPDWQRRTRKLVAAAEMTLPLFTGDGSAVVSPGDFGGDPTGQKDSTPAFYAAITQLLKFGGGRRNGANQTDLGGATLNLAGGVWAVSQPVSIPAYYANYRIEDGTIIAHPDFNSGEQYLLELGGICDSETAGLSKNCATDISVSEVTIDGRDRAWGGLSATSAVNVNIGPQVMVIGFQGVGLGIFGCGAAYVHDSWGGQYEAGDPTPRSHANATVILFDDGEHDSDLLNVIIFSGKVGVNSPNGANRLQGVHCWNLAGSQGGTGIVLHGGSGRVQDAYLDYAPLIIRAPGDVQVTGCLFLGSSNIVLTPGSKWKHSPVLHSIRSMIITSNIWHTSNKANTTIIIDTTHGSFTSLTDSVVEDNTVGAKHTGECVKKHSPAAVEPPVLTSELLIRSLSPRIVHGMSCMQRRMGQKRAHGLR